MLDSNDLARLDNLSRAAAQQPARPQRNYGQGTGAAPSTPGGAFTDGALHRVTQNDYYPSAAHQPMKFPPQDN